MTILCRGGIRQTSAGVEGAAAVAIAVAALTVYDMCKGLDRGIEIQGLRLLEKRGGEHGTYRAGRGRVSRGK